MPSGRASDGSRGGRPLNGDAPDGRFVPSRQPSYPQAAPSEPWPKDTAPVEGCELALRSGRPAPLWLVVAGFWNCLVRHEPGLVMLDLGSHACACHGHRRNKAAQRRSTIRVGGNIGAEARRDPGLSSGSAVCPQGRNRKGDHYSEYQLLQLIPPLESAPSGCCFTAGLKVETWASPDIGEIPQLASPGSRGR